MRKIILLFFIVMVFRGYSQSAFKYQARVNVLPIHNFYYASAFRVGIETTTGNWNFGVDLLTYTASSSSSTAYYLDSLNLSRKTNQPIVNVAGVGLNVIRAIKFKSNNNRFLFGVQGFVGGNVQTDNYFTEIYNPSHISIPGYANSSDYNWVRSTSGDGGQKHGPKSAFGLTPFARLELAINKRFTFTPEVMLPFIMMNQVGGGSVMDFNQGFNFCLGYKFGKV